MQNSEIILYIIKLVLGGITAFLAVSLWSKTKDAAWICLVLGFVISYAGIVYQMILDFGLLSFEKLVIFGIPIFKGIINKTVYPLLKLDPKFDPRVLSDKERFEHITTGLKDTTNEALSHQKEVFKGLFDKMSED